MTRRSLALFILQLLVIIGLTGMSVYQGINITKKQIEVDNLMTEVKELQRQYDRLEIDYSYASSPVNISQLVATYLPAMTAPHDRQFVTLDWFWQNKLVYNDKQQFVESNVMETNMTTTNNQ